MEPKPDFVCPYERVHAIEFATVQDGLHELKRRVEHVERALARGVMLLLANLAAIVADLLHPWN